MLHDTLTDSWKPGFNRSRDKNSQYHRVAKSFLRRCFCTARGSWIQSTVGEAMQTEQEVPSSFPLQSNELCKMLLLGDRKSSGTAWRGNWEGDINKNSPAILLLVKTKFGFSPEFPTTVYQIQIHQVVLGHGFIASLSFSWGTQTTLHWS